MAGLPTIANDTNSDKQIGKLLNALNKRLSTIYNFMVDKAKDDVRDKQIKEPSDEKKKSGTLDKVLKSIDEMGKNFAGWATDMKKGGKTLGMLAGLGLLIFDPAKFVKIISDVLYFIDDMTDALYSVIDGDWKKAFSLMSDHLVGIGVSLSVLAFMFGGRIFKTISTLVSIAGRIWNAGSSVVKFFGEFEANMFKIGVKVGKLGKIAKSVFGKLAWPITVFMGIAGAISGAMDGYREGGIIGAVKGALVGAFDAVIGGLLDMVKDVISWAAGALGFENVSAALDSFSFTGLFSKLVDAVFAPIEATIDWVKLMFSDPTAGLKQLWDSIAPGGILDIIFFPISQAISWVTQAFGWTDEEGKGFKLSDLFTMAINKMKEWFTKLFDFLPSLDEVKNTLISYLPSWMQPENVEEQRKKIQEQIAEAQSEMSNAVPEADINRFLHPFQRSTEDYAARLQELNEQLQGLPQARKGGIVNMPKTGGLAMLHGNEAIIPLDSSTGANAISNAFTTSPSAMSKAAYAMGAVGNVASQATRSSIGAISAPTVINSGGNSTTNITNIASGAPSPYSRPAYEL